MMDSNNPAPPGGGMSSGQNEIGHVYPGGHSYNNAFNAVSPQFWGPVPLPRYYGFGPRPFPPCPPVPPFGYRPPVFNVPPPSYSSVPAVHKTSDEMWLKNWLQLKTFNKCCRQTVKTVKISEVREKLSRCIQVLNKLDEKRTFLKDGINTLSEVNWGAKWAEVEKCKSDIHEMVNSLSEHHLVDVQKKLLKQVRKRARLKRLHAERKKDAHLAQLKRRSLHQKADAWLADMQLTVERAQKDEKLKKEADAVLAEVTHHQSEGRRQVALVEALQKLHQARLQIMEARGSKLSAEDQKNASQSALMLDRLLKLWSRKMEGYAQEEQNLRIMLKESAAKQSDLEIECVHQILRDWDLFLFGSENTAADDKLCDMQTLVSIRYAWDQYLVPNGVAVPMASTIPIGWVLPTTPSSSEWQHLLSKQE